MWSLEERYPKTHCHGGELSKKKRKTSRPVAVKRSMHVVLRASRARGIWSLRSYKNRPNVDRLIRAMAKKFKVRLYRYSINSNHIHLAMKVRDRELFQNFLRALAGNIACEVTGARKGNPVGKFWDLLAFSRIVEWGKAFRIVINYVIQNELEAEGIIPYRKRFTSILS